MTSHEPISCKAVLEKVQKVQGDLVRLKVDHLYLFGSVARNEGRPESDLDFLVEFKETVSLFELINLKLFLEDLFHRKVDVVPREDLREEIKSEVLRDAIRAA
jgi:uncharacterized protein